MSRPRQNSQPDIKFDGHFEHEFLSVDDILDYAEEVQNLPHVNLTRTLDGLHDSASWAEYYDVLVACAVEADMRQLQDTGFAWLPMWDDEISEIFTESPKRSRFSRVAARCISEYRTITEENNVRPGFGGLLQTYVTYEMNGKNIARYNPKTTELAD